MEEGAVGSVKKGGEVMSFVPLVRSSSFRRRGGEFELTLTGSNLLRSRDSSISFPWRLLECSQRRA